MDDEMLMNFHKTWSNLKPGPQAELRRVREPDDILDRPAFYRMIAQLGWQNPWLDALARLSFCIPYIVHTHNKTNLGAALGKTGKVNETRIFQVIRAEYPNDMIQLRRILQHVIPELNWPLAARQLYWWHTSDMEKTKKNKRALLEAFVLNQPAKSTK